MLLRKIVKGIVFYLVSKSQFRYWVRKFMGKLLYLFLRSQLKKHWKNVWNIFKVWTYFKVLTWNIFHIIFSVYSLLVRWRLISSCFVVLFCAHSIEKWIISEALLSIISPKLKVLIKNWVINQISLQAEQEYQQHC